MDRTYPERTITKKTGCGSLHVIIARKHDGKFHFIKIINEKDNACGNSWADGISDLLTFALRRATPEEVTPLLKNLMGHYCNNQKPNKDHITSCIDAIGKILREELGA